MSLRAIAVACRYDGEVWRGESHEIHANVVESLQEGLGLEWNAPIEAGFIMSDGEFLTRLETSIALGLGCESLAESSELIEGVGYATAK